MQKNNTLLQSELRHIQNHPLIKNNANVIGSPGQSSSRRSNRTFNNLGKFSPAMTPNYFGTLIPEHIMEDLLFRFLYNIPDIEKTNRVRVSFQVEQAHWFFVDFYCSKDEYQCKKIGFREFTRQVFHKCDYLQKWKNDVENIIDEFRLYKSSVPTYGIILLDSTLNYVLLVQGYFASKNSWGFPKGKVNEDEVPIQCAIREVLEETGFDATEKIVKNRRPLQHFLNDTLIRLYIATDVPMNFSFSPHLRKEIRKIAWFSLWELPKDRSDDKGCKKLGLTPNNFYTVIPFVTEIQNFARREQTKLQKPKITILRKDSSAFQPVIPKGSKNLEDETAQNITTSIERLKNIDELISIESSNILQNMFKPLKVKDDLMSFNSYNNLSINSKNVITSPAFQTPQSFTDTPCSSKNDVKNVIKQPKPIHLNLMTSNLIINVYEAPNSPNSTSLKANETKPTKVSVESKKTDNQEISNPEVFNLKSIFQKLQTSADSNLLQNTPSISNYHRTLLINENKNFTDNDEFSNESQRLKSKKQLEQKRLLETKNESKKSIKTKNRGQQQNKFDNSMPVSIVKSQYNHYNQGVSVDLAQLFGHTLTPNDSISTKTNILNTENIIKTHALKNNKNFIFSTNNVSRNTEIVRVPSHITYLKKENLLYTKRSLPKIKLCESWKNFKFNRSQLFQNSHSAIN